MATKVRSKGSEGRFLEPLENINISVVLSVFWEGGCGPRGVLGLIGAPLGALRQHGGLRYVGKRESETPWRTTLGREVAIGGPRNTPT